MDMETEENDDHDQDYDHSHSHDQDQEDQDEPIRAIGEIRQELANILGPNLFPKYLVVLQDWFGNKTLRWDWNISAPFLVGRAMEVHNELMTALLIESCRPDYETRIKEEPSEESLQYHQYQYQQSEYVSIKEEPQSPNTSLSVEQCIAGGNELEDSSYNNCTSYNQDVITLHSSLDDSSASTEFKPFQIQYKILSPNHQFLPDPESSQGQEEASYQNGSCYGEMENVDTGTSIEDVDYGNFPSPIPEEEDEEEEEQETDNLISVDAQSIEGDDEVEEFIPQGGTDTKFPPYFVKDLIKQDSISGYIPNVTHLVDVEYWLKKVPGAYKYFRTKPADPVLGQQPFVTSGASIEGKFYLSAWEQGVKSVSPTAISLALKATRDHIKRILLEVIKSRKAYEITKDGRIVNIGMPRMNPYLLSSTLKRSTDIKSMRYPDPVILPPYLPCDEEEERFHALKYACSIPPKSNRETKISYVDLLHLFQSDVGKDLIPNSKTRLKLLEQTYLNSKGYLETLKQENNDEDDSDSESESGEILSVCSY